VRNSFTAACRARRPASFSLEISVVFCPEKSVAALRSLALTKGFLWASATNASSSAGLDTRHNSVPLRLQSCPSFRYFCSHALAVDFGTPYSSPAALALNPPYSARAMTRSRIDLSWWAIVMRMKKSCNFKLTLSIRRLKDNPNADKTPSLIWASLGDRLLLERGRVTWASLLFWGPAILIRFGDLLVAGSEKDTSLPLDSLPLLVANRRYGYVCVLVWFRFGILVFILISVLWHIGSSVSDCCWATSMMGCCWGWGTGRLSASG
jgi:hypothetical protein